MSSVFLTRLIIIFCLTAMLLPSLSYAQNKEPVPVETSNDEKRKAEEARLKAMAEAEAARKKYEEEEARRKAAIEKLLKESAASAAGFQLLKIPVSGPYYLGMRQREYDSLSGQSPLIITTAEKKYVFQQTPNYFAGRLYMLSFLLPDSIFSGDMPDITAYYEYKLGEPDDKKVTDSILVFPNEEDTSLQGRYRVKKAAIAWKYNYHKVEIVYKFAEIKENTWKGFYLLRYAGTVEYVKGLAKLEELEKSRTTGN